MFKDKIIKSLLKNIFPEPLEKSLEITRNINNPISKLRSDIVMTMFQN